MGSSGLKGVLLFCLDLTFSAFWYPLMGLFLSPLYFYKSLVTLVARLIRPDLQPLDTKDQFMAWDLLTPKKPNERLVYNVGCSVRVSGLLGLQFLRKKGLERILGAVDGEGRKLYPRMEETLELFGGYGFRRRVRRPDINANMREVELGTRTVRTFEAEWISRGYPEEASPWEMVMIRREEADETYVLMKIHHSSADAYSLLHVLNILLDNEVPAPSVEPEDTAWEMFLQGIKCPRVSLLFSLEVLSSSFSPLPWSGDNREGAIFQSSTALSCSDLKKVHRKTGAVYTPITLALFGGVLARIIEEQESEGAGTSKSLVRKDKRSTYVQLSLPLPNHPLTKMCNHWTSGAIQVPLGPMSPLERLRSIDSNYKLYYERGLDKLMNRVLFPPGSLIPTKLFVRVYEAIRTWSRLGSIFTSAIGFHDDYYSMEGYPIISVSPLLGFLGSTPVITGLGFSYNDRYEVTMIATSQVAKDQATMDKIVSTYLSEELEKLVEEAESQELG